MVFVTGHEGFEITLNKAQPNLSVFDAGSIIQGLTEKEYCTTNYQFVISQSQRKKALDVLGNIEKVPAKISEVSGFRKIEKLAADGKIQMWRIKHAQGELVTRWLVHEVDTTSKLSSEAIEKLKDQAARLEQLSGVLGVPESLPLKYRNWEKTATALRFYKMHAHLNMLAQQRQGRRGYETAVQHWSTDRIWFISELSETAKRFQLHGFRR